MVAGVIEMGFVCVVSAVAVCGVRGEVDAWSAAGGLVSHDGALVEDFAAPDPAGLAPVQRLG